MSLVQVRSVDVELKRRCETGCGAAVRHEEDEQGEGDAQRHHQEGEHHLRLLEHSKSQVCCHNNCYGKESHKGNAHIDNGASQRHHQFHPISLLLTPTSFCGPEGVEGEHGQDEDTWMGEKCSRGAGEGAGEEKGHDRTVRDHCKHNHHSDWIFRLVIHSPH